jgi:transcriptional regulator with XRE-family HTH domain
MLSLKTESDVLREVADSLRARRLALHWRQDDLALKSGVSIATVRRFERSGQISFQGLAKLLVSLGFADSLLNSLKRPEAAPKSLEAFLNGEAPKRQRSRGRPAGTP